MSEHAIQHPLSHTPGPWTCHDGRIIARRAPNPEWRFIALVGDNPNAAANGRILAAAPELLDALETLTSAINDILDLPGIQILLYEELNKAASALAKTSG